MSSINEYLGLKFDHLEGSSNITKWESDLHAYLIRNKAAHRVLKGLEVEPFRKRVERGDKEWNTVYPPGQTAGDAPPSGSAAIFATERELNPHERQEWDAWATKELHCRSAILMTVPSDIRDAVSHLWCAHDIMTEIKSMFELKPDKRREMCLGDLQALHLTARCRGLTSGEETLPLYYV